MSNGSAKKSAARSARLSAALRENLKRRKKQARARELDRHSAEETPEPGTGLEVQNPDFRRNRGGN